jgi:hypothetical protein
MIEMLRERALAAREEQTCSLTTLKNSKRQKQTRASGSLATFASFTILPRPSMDRAKANVNPPMPTPQIT